MGNLGAHKNYWAKRVKRKRNIQKWERNGLARMAKMKATGQEMDKERIKMGPYSKFWSKEIRVTKGKQSVEGTSENCKKLSK